MKTILKLVIVLSGVFFYTKLVAQTPEGINYQAVLRDVSGSLMVNQNVDVIFSVSQSSVGGTVVYRETQALVTNAYGGFSAVIGHGVATSGIFASIDWSVDEYFLTVNVDGNDVGSSQLMSVPYALHAKTAEQVKNSIWKTKNSNGDYYTMGKSVVIGDSSAHAQVFTVRTERLSAGEMMDFRVDTMFVGNDILNLETGVETPNNSQFIECNKGGLKFSVNTDGSVYSKKQIKTDSSLIVNDEVNRSNTGSANLIPIAYGNVDDSGTINSGTGNFSVTKNSIGNYSISIVGESFFYPNYSVSLSIVSSVAGFISVSSSGGNMIVLTKDISGAAADKNFSFIVYKN
ncbi:MAG: hypothetical protein N4A35_12430 [Flavobacteriales bacterium]|jgi:hypothetical protein|nr:hypothetical protein [Flavobacteriales bacterium]